ncbi:MAG: hypothetical protein E6X23_12465 [Mixta calida]|jgi:hypothetical protein|uniref:Fumarase D n=1 Tax=Mixta calida TaxID=665913 RepID=A0ABN5HBY4_9GAMM|nr:MULTISPECIES: hypothetical protein [Mixta]AIX73000.1 hypothetical protein PSNIH2_03915 [Pantoea sp. PSNIH2]MBS6058476.1 hypothetical protein [Pantoea sp.]MDU5753855.1 hypothetical protein [Enterococcus faecalis]POU50288.1 hypothetical protein C3380_06770 [Pantoea sp. PSNIH5]POU69109.1 hypothetical protein C3374_08265 [Pantoea sp. PSNIH4]POY66409.1 hypothetical protein C3402_18545 [Pantoea sp. PSNIH3]HCW46469.1 hypothetical protein [Erwiniaceae bacterium]
MKDRAYESTFQKEDEVCCLIGRAVVELSEASQPVNKSTLSLKLLSMADHEGDDDRVLLYWLARKAINQPQRVNLNAWRQTR